MVGALLNVGAGNLDTSVIPQKLAMGSKDGPGETVTTVWSILDSSSIFLQQLSVSHSFHGLLAAQSIRLLMPLRSILHSCA